MTRPVFQHARRQWLRQAGGLALLGGGAASPLALNLAAISAASAQQAGDYKALVCVFMFGGNDSYNMVLPTDQASWSAYVATRSQMPDPIALRPPGTPADANASAGTPDALGGVLPLSPTMALDRSVALHPTMGALQTLFNRDRRLAIVPNVGPLLMPTTKTQFGTSSHPRPAQLFSHNDQQNTWQALAPEGASVGWGGRIADLLQDGGSASAFTSVSAGGNAVWLAGQTVRQYQLGSGGALRTGVDSSGRLFGSTAAGAALERVVAGTRSSHLMQADLAAVTRRAIDAQRLLGDALPEPGQAPFGSAPLDGSYSPATDPLLMVTDPLTGAAAANPLAQQLQTVARMIAVGRSGALGLRRQVFFVGIGGFDNHDNQNRNHAVLMARLAHALAYFDTTLGQMGALDQVCSFTASDFGRTFTSNGDGTDHGWGAHHFVMGGAVRGGNLYGSLPTLGIKDPGTNRFDSSPDQLNRNGAMLPTTSVDQLGATLARWMGVSDSALDDLFPSLRNFNQRDLGFLQG